MQPKRQFKDVALSSGVLFAMVAGFAAKAAGRPSIVGREPGASAQHKFLLAPDARNPDSGSLEGTLSGPLRIIFQGGFKRNHSPMKTSLQVSKHTLILCSSIRAGGGD